MPIWVEIVLRTFTMLIVLFIVAKIAGKKQISHFSYFDYVASITIGGIAAIVSIHTHLNLITGIISIFVITIIPYLLNLIALKSKAVRELIDGKGTVLIKDGKIMEDNLKKEQYTTDVLLKQLRNKNIFKIADVEFALLEPTGELNVLLKKEAQTVTLKDIMDKVIPEKEPQTVIMDGVILDEPLATIGLNRTWLKTELDKTGVAVENVYLAQVDSFGQLSVDLYDDKLKVPKSSEKSMLLASMKKCAADLQLFALETQDKKAKAMYGKNASKLQKAINQVEYLLKESLIQ